MFQATRRLILSKRFGLLSLFLILPLFAVGVGTINRFGDVILNSSGSAPIVRSPQIPTGAVAGSKNLTIQTGNNDGTGSSGDMSVYSGYTTSGASGWAAVISGDAASGASGDAYLKSGSSSTDAGDVWVLGGFGTTTGGDVTIEPGIGATDGVIYLKNSGEGTAGHVWTSVDSNGGGAWVAAPATPVGSVMAFALAACPTGWVAADGTAVSRTVTYDTLFAAMGTIHGTGNGTTTFNLPDYRGRFLRGVDGGITRDEDHASRAAMNTGGNTGNNVGSVQAENYLGHTHALYGGASAGGAQQLGVPSMGVMGTSAAGTPGYYTVASGGQNFVNTSGGNETRPDNAYVLYCVKY